MLQWAVREIEISNDCPLHAHISIQPWPPYSQVQCTSVKTDHGCDILDEEEHVHRANNILEEKNIWIFEKKHSAKSG